MSSRRTILEDSDDEVDQQLNPSGQPQDPSGIHPDNDSGIFSPSTLESIAASPAFQPYITTVGGEHVLANDAFINTIHDPAAEESTTSPPTEHAVLLTVDLLRKADKKIRMKLFKQKKAHVIFGLWWDYCLSSLQNNFTADATVVKILLSLLKFVHENLADVVKRKADVGKAIARFNVDLDGHVKRTKKAVDASSNECTELKKEVELAENHLNNLPGATVTSSEPANVTSVNKAVTKGPASEQKRSTPASQNTQSTSSEHKDEATLEKERQQAAKLERYKRMMEKNRQFRGVSAALPAAAASPPRSSRDSSGQTGGYTRSDSGQNSSGYDRKPPPESLGNNNYAASPNRSNSGYGRPTSNAAASHNNAPGSRDSGNGRRPPNSAGSNNREDSGFGKRSPPSAPSNAFSAMANDGWGRGDSSAADNDSRGRSSDAPAAADDGWGRNNKATAAADDGWGRSSDAPAAADDGWGRKNKAQAAVDDGWGRSSDFPAATDDGLGRNNKAQAAADDGWGRGTNSSVATATNNEPRANDNAWGRSAAPYSANNSVASMANENDDRPRAPTAASSEPYNPPTNMNKPNPSETYDNDGWGRSAPAPKAKPSVARTTVDDNRDQLWGQTLQGPPIPPYPGSNSAPTDRGHDSRANWESPQKSSGVEGYNRSDTEPSHRGGIIRNNQPAGGFEDRNSNYSQQPNRDGNYADPRNSYDRRDSRASSHQSGSFEPRNDDRRGDYDDRRSRGSSYRSDSPSSSRYNRSDSRGFDDRGRDTRDRFDDRKRDRDESSSRGSRPPKPCKFFFSREGCRTGARCRFSHEEDDRKPQADQSSDRSDYGRRYEDDRGSEEGEVRSTKRSRPNDSRHAAPSSNNTSVSSLPPNGGAGRGRGRNVNLPAWMTNGSATADVPAGAAAAAAPNQPTAAPLSNADLASVLSSVNGVGGSAAPAGRGRGNVDNRPAWITRSDSGPVGANGSSAAAAAHSGMNGRFAPPVAAASVRSDVPAQPSMGRGRGRGTDNRPAWMTRGEA